MLTQIQRARRRAKKINNRTRRALPLFAGTPAIAPFLTTEEAQLAAVQRWDEICQRYFASLEKLDNETLQRAAQYRIQLSGIIAPAELRQHDQRLEAFISKWTAFQQPEYLADYWGCILREKLNAAES